jgi:hypothetical protein
MDNNKRTWESHEEEFLQDPKKKIRKIIFWIIGLSLLISGIFWTIDLVMTPVQTAKDVVKKTLNADNVIQNYEWYKQQYNDYLAINSKIIEADTSIAHFKRDAGKHSDWSFEDKNEYSRLTSIADGLRYQRADIVGKYNARSKMLNRDIFKTSDLPAELPQ